MIEYNYETRFELNNPEELSNWVSASIEKENYKEGDLNYIFCTDHYLLNMNNKYLKHNTLTDIISFDYTMGKTISGDIFISIDRVTENALKYKVRINDELHRVMIHGVLHFCGFKDKTTSEKELMRKKEDYYLSLRTF